MIDVSGYLDAERVTTLTSTTKEGAILELVALAARNSSVEDPEKLSEAIFEREAIMSTGIGLEIAIPHAKIPSVKDFVIAIGRSHDGIDFASLDGSPVRIIVLIAGPSHEQQRYLEILAGVTLRLKTSAVRDAVMAAETPAETVRVLVEAGR